MYAMEPNQADSTAHQLSTVFLASNLRQLALSLLVLSLGVVISLRNVQLIIGVVATPA